VKNAKVLESAQDIALLNRKSKIVSYTMSNTKIEKIEIPDPIPNDIPGLFIYPGFITETEQDTLLWDVNLGDKWNSVGGNSAKSRRVQHHGYKYNYRSRGVGKEDYLGPLPEWSTWLEERIVQIPIVQQLRSTRPNQLIVNEYKPGQGIAWHTDAKAFSEPIVTVSAGSNCIFQLKSPDGDVTDLFLKPCTCAVMSGDSRWKWKHQIPRRATDKVEGTIHKRATRISFTYRWVPSK